MGELARLLRKEIAGETENPLVVIGLAPHVIDLGLSSEELFDYVTKDVARRLLMRFHPDRAAGAVEALQLRYAEAYERLQDRDAFERALEDFRSSRTQRHKDQELAEERLSRANQATADTNRELRNARDLLAVTQRKLEVAEGKCVAVDLLAAEVDRLKDRGPLVSRLATARNTVRHVTFRRSVFRERAVERNRRLQKVLKVLAARDKEDLAAARYWSQLTELPKSYAELRARLIDIKALEVEKRKKERERKAELKARKLAESLARVDASIVERGILL